MWGIVFVCRMIQKDYSLSKKAGWNEYAATSWMLPFKFGGSLVISFVIYTIFFGCVYFCLNNGGIEAGAKLALKGVQAK